MNRLYSNSTYFKALIQLRNKTIVQNYLWMIFFLNVFHSFTLKIKHSLEIIQLSVLIFGRVNVGGTKYCWGAWLVLYFGAYFCGAIIVGGSEQMSYLRHVRSIFQRSNCRRSNWHRSKCRRSNYRRSNCRRSKCRIFGASVAGAIMGGAIVARAKCRRSKCRQSKCRRSKCLGAFVAEHLSHFFGAIVGGAYVAGTYVMSPFIHVPFFLIYE